jgi:hypothetical protein
MAMLQRHKAIIQTNDPVRANRRGKAADLMAIYFLQSQTPSNRFMKGAWQSASTLESCSPFSQAIRYTPYRYTG